MKHGKVRDLFESVARWADRHSPQTVFARALIIIVVPMLLLQALSAWWFYSQRGDNVTNRLALLLVRDLRILIALHSDFPDDEHRSWIIRHARQDLLLYINFRTGIVRDFRTPERFDIVGRELQGALEADLRRPFFVDTSVGGDQVLVEVGLNDSAVMDVLVPMVRLTFGSSFAYVGAQLGLALVLFGLAIWFMRRELVPIEHLGQIAEALGKGRDVDFAFEGGTREVRNAASAFRMMRNRVRRQVQQRTEMLAGVSHDLRTPLTRMKLSLAMLPESAETRELGDDVVDMERMIEGYLAFARGEGDEDPIEVDLGELLQEVVSAARRNDADVSADTVGDMEIVLRPTAIKRVVTNLVSNGLRHGSREVEIRATRGRNAIELTVDDDGPGIPPDRRADVFRPFVRLDPSRNADTGGVGLGLTIARDIARSHGGDVALATSPLGGLQVVVRLPI